MNDLTRFKSTGGYPPVYIDVNGAELCVRCAEHSEEKVVSVEAVSESGQYCDCCGGSYGFADDDENTLLDFCGNCGGEIHEV